MKNYAALISTTARQAYAARSDIDQLEIRDAAYEDANGRMPWDPDYDERTDTDDRELDRRREDAARTD